jgi:hypothetical protein
MHVLDFSLFLRFACAESDAATAVNDLVGGAGLADRVNPAVEKAKGKVRRQARSVIALKRKQATQEARAVARQREVGLYKLSQSTPRSRRQPPPPPPPPPHSLKAPGFNP